MSSAASSELVLTTETMVKEFREKIRELETLALLSSQPCEDDLKRFATALVKAEVSMDELLRVVDRESQAINKSKELVQRLSNLRSRTNNLEKHLNKIETRNQMGSPEDGESEEEVDPNQADDNTITILQKAEGVTQLSIPSLKQFETVPRYMKGTLDYNVFSKICELVNFAANRKKLILEAPFDRLGPNARASLAIWKGQLSPEVAQLTFVTDDDVLSEIENDKRNLKPNDVITGLQCLRYIGVVRVSEYQNMNRYVFLK